MKTIAIFISVILFLVLCGFQPNDRKAKKFQKEKEMIQLIDSGQFRFVALSARSSLGNFNNLGSNYDLVFDSLNVKAYLPYYGRAYSVNFGGDGGVKFDLKANKIEKKWNKRKKMFTISTEVSNSQDSYSIYLTASPSGYGDLKINFRNRQMISYYGRLERIR